MQAWLTIEAKISFEVQTFYTWIGIIVLIIPIFLLLLFSVFLSTPKSDRRPGACNA